MTETLSELQEKVKRAKLERELKKYGVHEKKETKKHEYREHHQDMEKVARERIEKLQTAKGQLGGGIRNFLRKANINAQINQQRQFINSQQRVRNLGSQTIALNKESEYLKAKKNVQELRKTVNFDNILGSSSQTKKEIKLIDLGL